MHHWLAVAILLAGCHKAEPRVELDDFLRSDGHREIVQLANDIQASSERGDCAVAVVKAGELSALIDRLVPPASAMIGQLGLQRPLPSPDLIDYYMALRLDASVALAGLASITNPGDTHDCEELAAGVPGVRGVRKYRAGTVDKVRH
jgi:hypothetical protein